MKADIVKLTSKVVRPRSLTDIAEEMIRQAIVEGRRAFGEQVSESSLAEELGISKTPVREALLHLKQQGLVAVHPQRGTFVFQMSEEDVRELCGFRELIETAALAQAMQLARESLLEALGEISAATATAERKGDSTRIAVLDGEFHQAIVSASGSPYLKASYELIAHKVQALRFRLPPRDPTINECNHDHELVIAEIEAGSVARAQKILRAHIRNTQEAYIEASKNLSAA